MYAARRRRSRCRWYAFLDVAYARLKEQSATRACRGLARSGDGLSSKDFAVQGRVVLLLLVLAKVVSIKRTCQKYLPAHEATVVVILFCPLGLG